MKLFFSLFLIISQGQAQVIELGTIDNTMGLLDQRYTEDVTEHERFRSLRTFYEREKDDFEKKLIPSVSTKSATDVNVDQQWSELIGGT